MSQFSEEDYRPYNTMHSIVLPCVARHLAWVVSGFIVAFIVFLFVTPWVQTSPGHGIVTTLSPHDRAQHISAPLSGRIKEWYVTDGQKIRKGEPIVDIIDNDPDIIQRLKSSRDAFQKALIAAQNAEKKALSQYDRQKRLFAKKLSSERAVEDASIAYQNQVSRVASVQAQLIQANTQLSRQETQLIVAPRDGTIVGIVASDSATIVSAGDRLATFVPDDVEPAVEIYVSGLDVPLVRPNRHVRLQFEGWPAAQISGWSDRIAIGVFDGIVKAVDPVVSSNGRFRVLIVPDETAEIPWPAANVLRYGSKVQGWVLLDTVSVGYELWRQLNNFPPEGLREVASSNKAKGTL